jgi:hypothetical protein
MSARRSVLSLVPALRRGEALPGGAYRTRVEFLEFVIDDVRLGEVIRDRDGGATVLSDLVSVLVPAWPDGFLVRQAWRLMGQAPAELADGRLALYVCPECGDLGCGAVTVTVHWTGSEVVWADPGWQTDYEPEVDVEGFEGLGPFRFDRRQYDTVLTHLLHRDKPQPQGRHRGRGRGPARW